MKLTIIPSDGYVIVDGEARTVDMSDMPFYVHAVQWDGERGEIEFVPDESDRRLPNLHFSDITPFEYMIDRWRGEKRRVIQEQEEAQAKVDKQRAEAYAKDEAARSQRPM